MMSLFSSFDLKVFSSLNFIFILSFFVFSFWKNFFFFYFFMIFNYFIDFFKSLKDHKFKMQDFIFICLFILIFFFNFFSVFCYYFSFTSQLSLNLYVSLGMWLSLITFFLIKNFNYFFSHMVPEGTPLLLIFFLFLIELISNIIRPLTLMIRLLANILAGHLLMILSCNVIFFFPSFFLFLMLLNMVEIFVSFIQAYIFVSMVYLYFCELN